MKMQAAFACFLCLLPDTPVVMMSASVCFLEDLTHELTSSAFFTLTMGIVGEGFIENMIRKSSLK